MTESKKSSLLKQLNPERMPEHIAIIMDGNGRWAKSKNYPRIVGHRKGVERVKEVVELSVDIGLKNLTLYAFSTENWLRPSSEINALMKLLQFFLKKELKRMLANNVKFNIIGNPSKFPEYIQKELNHVISATSNNSGLNLILALNYGSKAEIVKAVNKLLKQGKKEITENDIKNELYTKNFPDPDIIIRTSNEIRLSNFLLWQAAYSEFYFTSIFWPEFYEIEFLKAILDYQKRERRFGNIKK